MRRGKKALRVLPSTASTTPSINAARSSGNEVRRLILTAFGRTLPWPLAHRALAGVTAADALTHPTWQMGPKITIDSAR